MNFTNEEKERINQLYGNDFKDITPEDAALIGRWEAWKATNESEHQAKLEGIKAETEMKLENARRESEQAMNNLDELKNAALARLAVLDDGQ